MSHHLKALRLAGLVQLTLGEDKGEDRLYATRSEAVASTFASLEGFLGRGEVEDLEDESQLGGP
jgi:hypothetical protein